MENNTYKIRYEITGNKLAGFIVKIFLPAKFVKQFKKYYNIPIVAMYLDKYGENIVVDDDEEYLKCYTSKENINAAHALIKYWKKQVRQIKEYINEIKDVEYVEEEEI